MEFFRYQFVRASDRLSDVIAVYSHGDFSHVDILLDDGTLLGARADIVGGKPSGVEIRPAAYTSWTKQVIVAIPCAAEKKAACLAFAMAQLHKPYDFVALASFVGKDWRSDNAWFCSELGVRVGEMGLWPEVYSPANHIEPSENMLIASAQAGRIITVLK